MVGIFGWLDASVSPFVYYVWFFSVGLLVLRGIAAATGRVLLALLVGLVTVVALPALIEFPSAPVTGLMWQGRYTLPLAVGIPVLAVYAIAPQRALPGGDEHVVRLPPRLLVLIPATLSVAHVVAFYWALRRYTVGVTGTLDALHGRWQPPLSAAGVTVLFAASVAAYATLLCRLVMPSGHRPDSPTRGVPRQVARRGTGRNTILYVDWNKYAAAVLARRPPVTCNGPGGNSVIPR